MATIAHDAEDRAPTRQPTVATLLSSKFALPAAPAALVPRPALTDRLAHEDGTAIVSIVAPAGYGKSTLLRQWADQLPNVAYVAIDDRDNDSVTLISSIAMALDRVEPLDPGALRLFASPGRSLESTLVPGLVDAVWQRRTPTVLMLDDVHRLKAPASLDAIGFLMLRLPPNLRLVLAARRRMPLPYARLRTAGHLLELDAEDLALDGAATQAMASVIGVRVEPDEVASLLVRTEGWPAATYLGLRSIGSARNRDQPSRELRGTDASMADYIRSELLDPLDPETRRWLCRSSALDTMSGPLCDAAIGTTGFARASAQARAGQPVRDRARRPSRRLPLSPAVSRPAS